MTLSSIETRGVIQQQQLGARRSSASRDGAPDILHLAELVPVVRQRLAIAASLPDAAILASLEAIARRSGSRRRWRAAFDSVLGRWLARHGSDLNTSLSSLVALLPKPLS